mgnify:CR=1 FL=1
MPCGNMILHEEHISCVNNVNIDELFIAIRLSHFESLLF